MKLLAVKCALEKTSEIKAIPESLPTALGLKLGDHDFSRKFDVLIFWYSRAFNTNEIKKLGESHSVQQNMQAAQIVHDDGPEPRRVKVKEFLTNYFQNIIYIFCINY